MSLQVWLPFNGSFENQGCGDYIITENSSSKVVYDDNGKIGKCKKAGQLKINKNPLGLNGTIAFWIWIDENYDRAGGVTLFGNNDTNAKTTNRKWSLHLHPNNYSLHSWGCQKDDANTANSTWTVSDCFTAQKWHHVAVAHDEKNQYVYIDSELKKTIAWSSSGKFTFDVETVLSYPHGGEGGIKMNDLRLYDHCLSKAEVQELAKGLVLHYTFDDPYCEDTTNLNSKATIKNSTTDGYTPLETGKDDIGDYYIKAYNSVDWTGVGLPTTSVTAGIPYTWSIDIMPDKDCYADFDANSWGGNYSGNDSAHSNGGYIYGVVGQNTNKLYANRWNRVYITCTTNADAESPSMGHTFKETPSAAQETIKFYYRNPQFEQKDHPTPFTTTKRTGEKVADSSGYERNAEKTNITVDSNTPINSSSFQFISTNKTTINKIPTVLNKSTTEFSIAFWFKANKLGVTHTIYTARTTTGYGIAIFGLTGNKIRFDDGTQDHQTTFSDYTYDTNWHHYVLTRSTSTKKLYVDGVLKQSSTNIGTLEYIYTLGSIGASDGNSDGIGDGNFSSMNLSDFRIYTTELNENNIKSLYQTKARINKNGTVFCNEYIEGNRDVSTNVEKTSILNTQKVSEQLKLYDMETTVLDDDSVWARVFYHNCHGGTVLFTSLSECRNTQTEDKYSRLAFIDEFRGEDGKFEFILRYPTDTDKYNRWKQLNNPCDEYVERTSTGEGVAEGYEPIHIDWSAQYWGGLTRQNSSEASISSCYLSGSVGHSNWHYAIGATSTHGNGIPTASGSTANDVEIWIRIDNAFIDRKNICPTSFDDWETGQYAWETGEKQAYNSRIRTRKLIKVSPSTQYYFTTNSDIYRFAIRQYDIDGNFVVSNGGITNTTVLTMNTTTHYIGGSLYNSIDDEVDTLSTYTTLFANGSIKPFICLNSETSKTFEMYNKDSQTSIENASFGKKFVNVKEIYEI